MRSEHAAALRLHFPHALERRLEAHAQRGLHSQCNAMLPRMQRLQTQHRVQKCTVVQIVLRGLGLSSALHSTEQYNTVECTLQRTQVKIASVTFDASCTYTVEIRLCLER